jgi:hypothetical protein
MRATGASFFGLPVRVFSSRYCSTFLRKWSAAVSGTKTVAVAGEFADACRSELRPRFFRLVHETVSLRPKPMRE